MFDNESTPVKACNDLPYYVSNNGNETSSFDSHDITNFLNSYTIACFCLWKLFFIQNGGIEIGNKMQRLNFYWNWGRFERERVGAIQRPFVSSKKAEDAAVWIRSLGNSSLQRRGFLEIQGRWSDLTIAFYGSRRKITKSAFFPCLCRRHKTLLKLPFLICHNGLPVSQARLVSHLHKRDFFNKQTAKPYIVTVLIYLQMAFLHLTTNAWILRAKGGSVSASTRLIFTSTKICTFP